jgi:hypothetical protein
MALDGVRRGLGEELLLLVGLSEKLLSLPLPTSLSLVADSKSGASGVARGETLAHVVNTLNPFPLSPTPLSSDMGLKTAFSDTWGGVDIVPAFCSGYLYAVKSVIS